MAENVVGSVVGKVRFNIDKKSWDNLALFQSKLTSVKRQMTGMDKSIKVNAVIGQINKVATATVNAEKKVAKAQEEVAKKKHRLMTFGSVGGDPKGYTAFWKEELTARDKLAKAREKQDKLDANKQRAALTSNNKRAGMSDRLAWMFPASAISGSANKTVFAQMLREEEKSANTLANELSKSKAKQAEVEAKKQRDALANSNKRAGMSDRLAWLFPASSMSNPANRGVLAQMLRDEEKASIKLQKEQDAAYAARRKDVMGRRNSALNARAARDRQQQKQDFRNNKNRTAFEAGVDNFMRIKQSQIRQYSTQRNLKQSETNEMLSRLEASRDRALKEIDPTQARAIETFRQRLNETKNEMVNSDRVTRKNAVSFKSLRSEIVQLTAAYSAFTVVQNIAQEGMALEGIRAAAKVFTGSDAGTAEHMEYLVEMTDRLGVNFMTAAKEFNKFSIAVGSKADQKTQRHIFEGLSEYATVLQVDQQQYERGIRSVVQMFSKEQVYAEELRGQLAEALPGSVAAMMRASGFTSEKDFFKAVEAGKIMASEVMPKFADELKKIARTNGALEATTKKTRAEMQRFFNQLTYAKDAIFQGGMDEGLSYMFGSFADVLKELEPVAKALGAMFRGAIVTITGAIKVALLPFRALVGLFDSLGDNLERLGVLDGSGGIWSLVGAGGVLTLMATQFKWVTKAIWGANSALVTMAARFAPIIAAYLAIEDLAMYAMYGDNANTLTGKAVNLLKQKDGDQLGNFFRDQAFIGTQGAATKQLIEISMKGDADNLFNVIINKVSQSTSAITQMETAQ
jgi:tape measure domain-containing protein